MIEKTKQALMRNWGDIADSLDCYAEIKFIDSMSSWACYVYAMNPEDEDYVVCAMTHKGGYYWNLHASLSQILSEYNENGEHPVIDHEFRRTKLKRIIDRL